MSHDLKKFLVILLTVIIFTGGLVLSTFMVTQSLINIKGTNTISVTGSAKKQIKSDLIVWQGSFSAQAPQMADAYAQLKVSLEKVKKYLIGKGIEEKDMVVSSIITNTIYEMNFNGIYTNNVIAYRLEQRVEISSSDVDKITGISREATELINEGVDFQSMMPQYFYTKIADLKVSMLAEATKDAKNRAVQIAENTGSSIGALRSAKMGVFQITPLYSTEVADYGINDTSSIEKEITAVVTCNFEMK